MVLELLRLLSKFSLVVVFITYLLMASSAFAQQVVSGLSEQILDPMDKVAREMPLPTFSEIQPRVSAAPMTHAFWDRTNLLLFSGVAVFRGLDYASTRNMQARGRKEILLAPEVVNNSAAFASLEAAGAATSVGISYIFHRTGHHKLERWMSITHLSVTAFGDVRNYGLESRHRR